MHQGERYAAHDRVMRGPTDSGIRCGRTVDANNDAVMLVVEDILISFRQGERYAASHRPS